MAKQAYRKDLGRHFVAVDGWCTHVLLCVRHVDGLAELGCQMSFFERK